MVLVSQAPDWRHQAVIFSAICRDLGDLLRNARCRRSDPFVSAGNRHSHPDADDGPFAYGNCSSFVLNGFRDIGLVK